MYDTTVNVRNLQPFILASIIIVTGKLLSNLLLVIYLHPLFSIMLQGKLT